MKRWVSILLVCCMLMTLTPAALAADTDEAETGVPEAVSDMPEAEVSAVPTVQSETAAPLSDTADPSEIIDSGYCGGEGDGTNLTWTLTAGGTLTISGEGEMKDYQYSSRFGTIAPWSGENIVRAIMSSGVTSIGRYAFYECKSITDTVIPYGVIVIGLGAFNGCESLTSVAIPDSVTSIAGHVFSSCKSLTQVNIPESVAVLEEHVFHGCTSLTSIDIPNSVTKIGKAAFYECTSLAGVVIPENVIEIGSDAFAGCTSLVDVIISGSITEIGYGTFEDCTSLTDLVIPASVTTIGENAFSHCESLTSVTIPSGVVAVGKAAFMCCRSLTDVVIPENVTSIGSYAFEYCDNLTNVAVMSDAVSIGKGAFVECDNLSAVYFIGNAPAVFAADESYYVRSFSTSITLCHIPGTAGWTDSEYYDADTGTWNGYTLDTWVPDFYRIKTLTPDGIEINGRGYPRAHFVLLDYMQNPLGGQRISYQMNGKTYTTVSDGNGLFSVAMPETAESKDYQIVFSMPDYSGELKDAEQTISVTVTPLSYSQKWSGALGVGAEVGIGPGFGAGVGDVSFEANAVKASASAKVSGELSLEDSYDDGERTLEVVFKSDKSVGAEIKTGVEATAPNTVIDVAKASVGAKVAFQNSVGLKIPNYSPYNMDQAIDLGSFLLQISLMCVDSATAQIILDLLDIDAHNQSGYTNKVVLEAGASIGTIETSGNKKSDFELLGADASAVVSFSRNRDFLENTEVQAVAFGCDLGLSALSGIKIPAGGGIFDSSVGNNFKLSATFDGNDELSDLSYKIDTEGSGDVLWFEQTYEDSVKVSYDSYEAGRIVENDALMQAFVNGDQTLFMPAALVSSVLTVERGDYQGVVEESRTIKEGTSFSFPVKIDFGLSIEPKLSGTFMEEFSYAYRTGIYSNGHNYTTAVSTVSQSEFESQRKSLTDIIDEAMNAVVDSLKNYFVTKVGNVVDGVVTGFAELTGTEGWFAEIGLIDQGAGGGSRSSYAVLALSNTVEPISNAAVAVTIGDPYTVAIYTDSSKKALVSDKELALSPLTITLSYDWSMLDAAGVGYDADITIYRYDSERNTYIPVPNCVQDKDYMTVTAPIAAHGEYILATDNASPLVSNFVLSNQTAVPTFSVLVSDLSGIDEFSFWLDDGDVLVGIEEFEAYYDYSNNAFTYTFDQTLTSGEHTVYFQAADALGNANAMPFSFTFTVDAEAPVISEVVVPADIVTDPAGFSVTACVSDNEQVSQVVLSIVTDEGKNISVPMSEVDGIWTADVVELEGISIMNAAVVAFDWAGNRSESEPYAIEIDVPDAPAAIALSAEWIEGGWSGVSVTVKTNQNQAIGGWLICAVYNQDGKMVGIDNIYAGLQAIDEQTYTLTFDCDTAEIYSGTVFFVDINNGYTPFCEGVNLPLRAAD